MSDLREQIERTLLPGMYLPKPLGLLFEWIESNGLFVDTDEGRIGYLYPEDKLRAEWTETERPGGTKIEFHAVGNIYMNYWFGHDRKEAVNRVCEFAKTGADGSMAAFWIDDDQRQRIVHLGSGSGSTLVCVLADDPVDFLRLIAIGYDEICWSDAFPEPPNAAGSGLFVHQNREFRNWVERIFGVRIPRTAAEIVHHASRMEDANSDDPFWLWVKQNAG